MSETDLCPNIPDETVKNLLLNWSIHYRYDAPYHNPHMGIICLIPKKNPKSQKKEEKKCTFFLNYSSQVQVWSCNLNKHFKDQQEKVSNISGKES